MVTFQTGRNPFNMTNVLCSRRVRENIWVVCVILRLVGRY